MAVGAAARPVGYRQAEFLRGGFGAPPADTPGSRLVALMTDRGLRHLPVVDDDGRLVGIVTRTELIAVLNQALVES